ncbi:MAG TPA: hypothetical protein VJ647_02595, partial [Chitinophagaceae bacterium]|nr:hypothetical protein [Chitinophagaceae bacterium]
MRRLLAVVLVFSAITHSQAQIAQEPAYKRFPTLPPFTLLGVDSSAFSRDDLPKHKKTLIMYFSPECDHCKHQTEDMLKEMNRLKGIQIVMATYQPFEEMTAFYKNYNLARYSNIKIGRDIKYFFAPYYQLMNLPYLGLYDAKWNLITTFEGNVSVDKLVKA